MAMTMRVINAAKHTCIEEAYKDIQNLNVVLLQNLAVAFVGVDFLKDLI